MKCCHLLYEVHKNSGKQGQAQAVVSKGSTGLGEVKQLCCGTVQHTSPGMSRPWNAADKR